MNPKSLPRNRWLRAMALAACAVWLVGCTSTVYTKVNAFRAAEAEFGKGTVAVRAGNEDAEQSLEFAYYREQLEHALANLGYTPVARDQNPEYEAFLSFSVDEAEASERGLRTGAILRSYPYYGYGSYGFGSRFGVVVMDENEETQFLRRLGLVIARSGGGERVYEVKGVSRGECGVFSVVFDEMLQAVLKDFPAANGVVKDVGIKGDTRC